MNCCKYFLTLGLACCLLGAQEPSASADKPPVDKDAAVRKVFGLPPAPNAEKVTKGKNTFVANCAFCHGGSATGGEGGPDLVRSVLVLHDKDGDKIGPVIMNGRPSKGMPKFSLTEVQISQIAAFLKAQAEAKSMRFNYKIQNIVTGDAQVGARYFQANCAGCHSAQGDLAGIANRFDPTALQTRFLYPKTESWPPAAPGAAKAKPITITVTLPGGQTMTGILQHMDDFNVSLYDAEGGYHSWIRADFPGLTVSVQDPLAGHAALLAKYSDQDMHNVLAYLETLK